MFKFLSLRATRERKTGNSSSYRTQRRTKQRHHMSLRFEPLEDRTLLTASAGSYDGLPDTDPYDWMASLPPVDESYDWMANLPDSDPLNMLCLELKDIYHAYEAGVDDNSLPYSDFIAGDRVAVQLLCFLDTFDPDLMEQFTGWLETAGMSVVKPEANFFYGHIAIDRLDELAQVAGVGVVFGWSPQDAGIAVPAEDPVAAAPTNHERRAARPKPPIDTYMVQTPEGEWQAADFSHPVFQARWTIEKIDDAGDGTRTLYCSALPDDYIEPTLFFIGDGPQAHVLYNLVAADTTNTQNIQPGGSLNLDLEGEGYTLGVFDVESVNTAHVELAGRVTSVDATPVAAHATGVAGTAAASGASLEAVAAGQPVLAATLQSGIDGNRAKYSEEVYGRLGQTSDNGTDTVLSRDTAGDDGLALTIRGVSMKDESARFDILYSADGLAALNSLAESLRHHEAGNDVSSRTTQRIALHVWDSSTCWV